MLTTAGAPMRKDYRLDDLADDLARIIFRRPALELEPEQQALVREAARLAIAHVEASHG